jgi:Cu2+-exporting ATPase
MEPDRVPPGARVLVAAGERIPVDGTVAVGAGLIDTSLVTGEATPCRVAPGDAVFAGTLCLDAPLTLSATAVGEGTLLADVARTMEAALRGRSRYIALADRVARRYAPIVHALALLTFLGWTLAGGLAWQPALMIAIAVLIITCPCALALAVPTVQVVASGRLMREGVLVKSPTALERLAQVDTVVFDKTGTLTRGLPVPDLSGIGADTLRLAAALAAASRHPLARALSRAAPSVPALEGAREVPGEGMAAAVVGGEARLGRAAFCGVKDGGASDGPELWLAAPGIQATRIGFADALRADAIAVIAALKRDGYGVEILSGDRAGVVDAAARACGIETYAADRRPLEKAARLEALAAQGRHVLMVGDGLNDAPALGAAHVSLSPATGADISQAAADAVFQGDRLAPVRATLAIARRAQALTRQNLTFALGYNALAVPLAMAGFLTPLIAAVAMSSSSVFVIANALRLRSGARP